MSNQRIRVDVLSRLVVAASDLLLRAMAPLAGLLCLLVASNGAFARSGGSKASSSLTSPKQVDEAAGQSDEKVDFAIRLKDGKSQFKMGEVITVELRFSANLPDAYQVSRASYDRSGRLEIDQYEVEPAAATSDPLFDYFQNSPSGLFQMGGLSSSAALTKTPMVITADLNEWVRIDRPGNYRLSVTSNRVTRKTDDQNRPAGSSRSEPITSNVLEFEVLPPDAARSKQKLKQATGTLDSSSATGEEKRAAARTLRFLDTPEAAAEMVRRVLVADPAWIWDLRSGILATPHRLRAIQEMKTQIANSDAPITEQFVTTLATLDFYREHSPPQMPTSGDNSERSAQFDAICKARTTDYASTLERYTEMLAAAVDGKTGDARAVTLSSLLSLAKQFSGQGGNRVVSYQSTPHQQSVMSSLVRKVARSLPSQFLSLPRDEQLRLLDNYWADLAGPEMLPVLKQALSNTAPNQAGFYDLVLCRLYQLDPEQGRAIIINEIRRLSGKFSAKALGLLPDQELPAQDNDLATNLESAMRPGAGGNLDVAAQLVSRYGSPAILSRVQTLYADKGGDLTSASQVALLAYFFRVDPAAGADFTNRAQAAGAATHRYQPLLSSIGEIYMCPPLERIATDALSDPEPAVVADAIAMLGRYGSDAAQAPLMLAFEQWHEQWKDHEAEMRDLTTVIAPGYTTDPVAAQPYFERELTAALGSGRGWLTDERMINKLESFCLTQGGVTELEAVRGRMKSRRIDVSWSAVPLGYIAATVAQYNLSSIAALKIKLSEFPKGTTFTWEPSIADDETRPIFADLKTYLQSIGMELVAESH
jgi:hypothetical protein